jgi:putative CocE/NonD family hydrolase
MLSSIRVNKNIPMKMRDGVVLRADIFRPDDNERHPAVLIRTPYNKTISRDTDFLNLIDAVSAGYVVVTQDTRGRFASEGEWRFSERSVVEGPDGFDSVEWVAVQPWCGGNVGMTGVSYNGVLCWLAAIENPPHLKAIAPCMTMGILPRDHQGNLSTTLMLHLWISQSASMALDILTRLENQGKDVSMERALLNEALLNPERVYNYLPLKQAPHFRYEAISNMWNSRLERAKNPHTGEQAENLHSKVKVPCFQVGGWYDIYAWGIFDTFIGMKNKGATRLAKDGQHLIVGPWVHNNRLPSVAGDINFGMLAGAAGANISDWQISFFDKYLKGIDASLPAIRYFVMGKNIWQSAETWPLPRVDWKRFFIHSKGHANTSGGDGELNNEKPGNEEPDSFIYEPANPVPSLGGKFVPLCGLTGGCRDESHSEKRRDVLCYSSPELSENIEVTGPLDFHLFASTSAHDTDFVVKLTDVLREGPSFTVAEGITRARYRNSIFAPEAVNPGEIIEFIINMANTSYIFKAGHRVRIDITSSNFPGYDRNLNTGNGIGEDAQGVLATQRVFHQSSWPSYIDLPVIPD